MDRHKHAATHDAARHAHARHDTAPTRRHTRQAAFAHTGQQRVVRVQIDKRFGHVVRQLGRAAGARHGVPLVAHAAGVEDKRVVAIGRMRGCAGRCRYEARTAIGMGEAAIAEEARFAVTRLGDGPLHWRHAVVGIGIESRQATEVECTPNTLHAACIVGVSRQARVLIEHVARAFEIEAVVTHAAGDVGDDVPVGSRFTGRWQEGALARDTALGVRHRAVFLSPAERGQEDVGQHGRVGRFNDVGGDDQFALGQRTTCLIGIGQADHGVGAHDPHGLHLPFLDGVEQVYRLQAHLVGHARGVPERLHQRAMRRLVQLHVRGQHVG